MGTLQDNSYWWVASPGNVQRWVLRNNISQGVIMIGPPRQQCPSDSLSMKSFPCNVCSFVLNPPSRQSPTVQLNGPLAGQGDIWGEYLQPSASPPSLFVVVLLNKSTTSLTFNWGQKTWKITSVMVLPLWHKKKFLNFTSSPNTSPSWLPSASG